MLCLFVANAQFLCAINVRDIIQNYFKIIKLDECKDISEINSGICKEKNHKEELKYFCKKHNKLCCVKCIAKIKDDENGQHSDL